MDWKLLTENYKKLMVIPILLIALSIFSLYHNYLTKGVWLERSFELVGGTRIIITTEKDLTELVNILNQKSIDIELLQTPLSNQLTINLESEVNQTLILNEVKNHVPSESIQLSHVGPELGGYFWNQVKKAIPFVLLGIMAVVFIYFKSFIPALTIIGCLISNLLFVLGMMAFFDIQLSFASLGAILMILGYSVDDDILLYTYVLKRKGPLDQRIIQATKTGITMTSTALVAALCLYLVPGAEVLQQIGKILLFGLAANYPFTWIQSAGILKIYLER